MKNKITSLFFAGLLISIAILNIITPQRTFSGKENRYLQLFPDFNREDIISGKFGDDFEKYSSDQFVARNFWISLKTISDLAILKKDNDRVYFGKEDYLFDLDKAIKEEQEDKNIANINKLLINLRENHKDIDVYALLVPSKSQTLQNKLPDYAPTVDEEKIIDSLKFSLEDNINILSLIDILRNNSDEYIYYRTDHHWTSKGAYYGYQHFLKSKGDKPLDVDDFAVETVSKDFLGTSYRKANYYTGKPDNIDIYTPKDPIDYNIKINEIEKEDSLYDNSFLNKTDKYSYFLGGDKAVIEIETSIKNGKTILIIKDSFANSFIPFAVNNYEKVIAIDPRYFNIKIADYIEGKDIDEIVFLFSIQNFIQEKALSNI